MPRWSIEIQAGMQGNFFVSSKDYGPNYNRPNFYEFYQKNFLGTVAGADVIYQIDRRSRLGFGYMVSKNKKQVNFVGVNNGFYIV
ncbi:MAG TPA: hypothetical protein VLL95_05655, partial [Phnomibacter sp.]|nr:hypothetical protein [Phnomibacter sp.]